MKFKELDKLNGITILTRAPNRGRKTMYHCMCHCGNLFMTSQSNLNSNHTTSCGCIHDYVIRLSTKHSNTKLYNVYRTMKNRCYNKNSINYDRYGGRGITVNPIRVPSGQIFYG